MSEFPLLSPRPESALADPLQVVGAERQLGRGRRHSPEEARQQCIENSGEHVDEQPRHIVLLLPSLHLCGCRSGLSRLRCCVSLERVRAALTADSRPVALKPGQPTLQPRGGVNGPCGILGNVVI